jgi:hypothetical protein
MGELVAAISFTCVAVAMIAARERSSTGDGVRSATVYRRKPAEPRT